eukprot:365592-Chlamydomonas_euryale.AAC.9
MSTVHLMPCTFQAAPSHALCCMHPASCMQPWRAACMTHALRRATHSRLSSSRQTPCCLRRQPAPRAARWGKAKHTRVTARQRRRAPTATHRASQHTTPGRNIWGCAQHLARLAGNPAPRTLLTPPPPARPRLPRLPSLLLLTARFSRTCVWKLSCTIAASSVFTKRDVGLSGHHSGIGRPCAAFLASAAYSSVSCGSTRLVPW